MKFKILFFIFDLSNGGAEKVLVQLVNALNPEKYDITVQTVFNYGINKDGFNHNIKRKTLFNGQFRGMKYIVRLFPSVLLHKLLIREHYDYEVAYLEGIPTRVISGCRDKATKTFAWVHVQMDNKNDFFNTYLTNCGAHNCYQHFDRIAFVSEVARSSFLEKTGWKLSNTGVVHNTLDIDSIKRKSQEDISLNLDGNVVNLCSVGRLATQKGYPRLVTVLSDIYKQGIDNWHLYILGQGEMRQEIELRISETNLQDHITLLGYDANPYKYVSKMDFFVCSSFKEGYSTAVTESIIVQTPVITTDCAGMNEILSEASGLITDNSDVALKEGLIRILTDADLRKHYKQGAIERSSFFSQERTLKEFEDFIEN